MESNNSGLSMIPDSLSLLLSEVLKSKATQANQRKCTSVAHAIISTFYFAYSAGHCSLHLWKACISWTDWHFKHFGFFRWITRRYKNDFFLCQRWWVVTLPRTWTHFHSLIKPKNGKAAANAITGKVFSEVKLKRSNKVTTTSGANVHRSIVSMWGRAASATP